MGRLPAVSKRPGGLTALSVLNFVFGGLGLAVAMLEFAIFLPLRSRLLSEGGADAARQLGRDPPSMLSLYVVAFLGVITGGLLIASGIGYIQQKKLLGRTFGTIYAAIAMFAVLLQIVWVGQNFGMFTLFYWVYPLLTLFFLYSVFRHDFAR